MRRRYMLPQAALGARPMRTLAVPASAGPTSLRGPDMPPPALWSSVYYSGTSFFVTTHDGREYSLRFPRRAPLPTRVAYHQPIPRELWYEVYRQARAASGRVRRMPNPMDPSHAAIYGVLGVAMVVAVVIGAKQSKALRA